MQKARKRPYARSIGVVYLAYFVVALLGLFLAHHKIAAGALMNWLPVVLYAALTILLYRLFRPAQPLLALAAALCSLAGCAFDGLHVLHRSLTGFSPLMFFGPFCVLLGVLILRSRFLPRWLGSPLIVAGLCWLTYLVPVVALHTKQIVIAVGFVAEFELMLWLLLKGVDKRTGRNHGIDRRVPAGVILPESHRR
jgi:hypothetical protein